MADAEIRDGSEDILESSVEESRKGDAEAQEGHAAKRLGRKVTSRKQAIAIGLSEVRNAARTCQLRKKQRARSANDSVVSNRAKAYQWFQH